MIKIEFPADRPDIALAMGQALLAIASKQPVTLSLDKPVQLPGEVTPSTVTGTFSGGGEEEQEVPPVSTAAAFGAATANPAPKTATQPAARLDTKGVAFHADFCATAADPFYASGSRAGQWKKRKGVADDTYDNWYALQPRTTGAAPVVSEYPEEEDETPVNTAAAFGAAPAQSQQTAAATVPRDTGAFMGWLSERQAAGVLTQVQINQAYQTAGVLVTDLFPPTPADKVATNIASVYGLLVAQGA